MDLGHELPIVYNLAVGDYKTDLAYTDTVLARSMWEKAVAFYTMSNYLLNTDHICPDHMLWGEPDSIRH